MPDNKSTRDPSLNNKAKSPGKKKNPLRYHHIRQSCPGAFFNNIVSKDEHKPFFCFITPENQQHLAVQVISPILRRTNRAEKKPVQVNILFSGQPVLKWRKLVFWKDNGSQFVDELNTVVGRALRLYHKEKIFRDGDIELVLVGESETDQQFINQVGVGRAVRNALLD